MYIQSANLIYFSPTRSTKKILMAIAKGFGIDRPKLTDITTPAQRSQADMTVREDIAVIGMPVYEEFIPDLVRETLKRLKGNGQPLVLVSVYGNIGFGMSLVELNAIAAESNLRPIAAAAFIAEHSFANSDNPLATGRPDENDLQIARNFGVRIGMLIQNVDSVERIADIQVTGAVPLMSRILSKGSASGFTKEPVTNPNCNRCKACGVYCPAGAIGEELEIDPKLCVRCFACVKNCKFGGRQIEYKIPLLVKAFLKRNNRKRKEPQFFY